MAALKVQPVPCVEVPCTLGALSSNQSRAMPS